MNPNVPAEITPVSRRPVIGMATQTQEGVPGQAPAAWGLGQRYVRALTSAGAVPWLVPLLLGDADTRQSARLARRGQ